MKAPYTCPTCGHGFSGPYVRCIGTDGKHVPTVPQPSDTVTRFKGAA